MITGKERNRMSELKPCPFCGGEARIEKDESGHNSVVICFGCFINDEYNMWYQTKQEAIKAWNHRPAKPVSKEDLAEYCHDEQWSGWMKYLFEKTIEITGGHIVIPKWAVERWTRQMNTKYKDLPDEEKESDIKEAEAIINKYSVHERNE